MLAAHVEDRFQSAREVIEFLDAPAQTDGFGEGAFGAGARPLVGAIQFGRPGWQNESGCGAQFFEPGRSNTGGRTHAEAASAAGAQFVEQVISRLVGRDEVPLLQKVERPATMRSVWEPSAQGFHLVTPIAKRGSFLFLMLHQSVFLGVGAWELINTLYRNGNNDLGVGILFILLPFVLVPLALWWLTKSSTLDLQNGQLHIVTKNWFKVLEDRVIDVVTGMHVECQRKETGSVNNSPTYSYRMAIHGKDGSVTLGQYTPTSRSSYICVRRSIGISGRSTRKKANRCGW